MDMTRLEEVYKKWEQRSLCGWGEVSKSAEHGDNKDNNRLSQWHTSNAKNRKVKTRSHSWNFTLELIPDLVSFKTTAPVYADQSRVLRPFMGRCCTKCVPISRGMFYDNDAPSMRLRDLLKVPPSSGFISRRFPVVAYEYGRKHSFNYPPSEKVITSVLNSDRVQAAIQKSAMSEVDDVESQPEKYPMALQKHASRAYYLLSTMVASISNKLIAFTGWFLLRVLCNFISGIQVHTGQMAMVKQASEKDIPLIFLPIHRSHLDYILITYILHQYDIKSPHVAAGDNLNIPIFGWILRHLGGFFIKRKLDKEDGKKDWVYRAILHNYMLEVLKQNQSLEFFIEGGRSRSGKALMPKGGLLSVVVDAYMDGTISDAYIVPIGISYEKILEGNFNREQMGNPKVKESFLSAIHGVYKVLRGDYGTVRVGFAEPFSLQEYLQSAQPYSPLSSDLTCNGPRSPKMKSVGSDNSIYGTDIVRDDLRTVIKGLADHVIYDAVHTQSIMSTNLLSFLLLTKFRQGATIDTISESFESVRQQIIAHGRDVGFSGKAAAIVNYASHLLGDNLVSRRKGKITDKAVSDADEKECVMGGPTGNDMLIPNTCLPDIFELSYYSNPVISVFLMEAVIATAISAVSEHNLQIQHGHEDYITVSRDALVHKATELCDLLQFEFTFIPPCGSLQTIIIDALERLTSSEIIQHEEPNSTCLNSQEKSWADRLVSSTSWKDEDDEQIQPDQLLRISLSAEHVDKLTFLQSMLGPLIESYWIAACNLIRLMDRDLPEAEYTSKLLCFAKERVYKGLSSYAESCALETLKTTIRLFIHWKVLDVYHDAANKKMIQLKESYREEEKLNALIDKIEDFKL
ncbi:glycerol-3-phosphate acyltransferase 1, mitochondrial-like [Saccoglossus kowalevskii]|uniref:Glycerol-3-phosphate acyltransferase 1, mitochondrial-like n=1 Tax=Saccoglossus kowalevskii TaxID=10224 RepID=A0ABM0GJT2_SACKO|nr:PREDICTED: glycerol-3-phosphate acyltransferase 1, mitochondrial-like [Saccoglossus kowalevskii]